MDADLRHLERRAAQGDDRAAVTLLGRRIKSGDLGWPRVGLAAFLGHGPSRTLEGGWNDDCGCDGAEYDHPLSAHVDCLGTAEWFRSLRLHLRGIEKLSWPRELLSCGACGGRAEEHIGWRSGPGIEARRLTAPCSDCNGTGSVPLSMSAEKIGAPLAFLAVGMAAHRTGRWRCSCRPGHPCRTLQALQAIEGWCRMPTDESLARWEDAAAHLDRRSWIPAGLAGILDRCVLEASRVVGMSMARREMSLLLIPWALGRSEGR